MARSLLQPETKREIQARIARLSAAQAARWGRLSAPRMVVHLTDSMKMATGDLTVAPKRVPLRYPPLKQLVIYWLPFPKGVPTAPELLARAPTDWATELSELLASIDRFAGRDPAASWPDHPAFGRMSGRQWGVLAYRHIDHHLRQFGG
jgi:hypothetical protein